MEIVNGMVVKSLYGHDKDSFYVVIKADQKFVYIADGKRRSCEKPKKKNRIHVSKTNTVFAPDKLHSDKKIRKALWPFNYGEQCPTN